MQTALHIHALVRQMNRLLIGSRIYGTAFYKKERTAYFYLRTKRDRLTLGMVYHPRGHGVFLVKASKVQITTREKPWPLFSLESFSVTSVRQIDLDRVFCLGLESDSCKRQLLIEALGPNGNIWLLDDNSGRLATLRKRQFSDGEPYQYPGRPDKLNPFDLKADRLLKRFPDRSPRKTELAKAIIGFTPTLAAEALKRAEVESTLFDESIAIRLSRAVTGIATSFSKAESGYLYRLHEVEVYPLKLSSINAAPDKFKTLSLAVLGMVESRQSEAEQVDIEKRAHAAIEKAIERTERKITRISEDLKRASNYEQHKKHGELLQINHNLLRRGMDSITVTDVHSDSQNRVTISLDPALSPKDNIERYFKQYRKGREGLSLLKRRLDISKDELERLREIKRKLQMNFTSAYHQFTAEISSLLPKESVRRESVPRLPYREHTLSTGVTVFIGREGLDNDRTTFEFAKPYELWFHTQQCPGSHVVMKFPNKSFEPSKREIEEAASFAAWHSKARKNSLVPVIYTQKKYVRKPRKAKPGLVTVEREKSVMVEPAKPK